MTLARWNMLKKLGTYAMRRRRPAIFSVRLCLVSHALSRCAFWLVLHAWQRASMSELFMLLWPTVVVQLWQLCTNYVGISDPIHLKVKLIWHLSGL